MAAPTDDELMAQALRAIAARNSQGVGGVAAVAADPNNNGHPVAAVVAPQDGVAGALPPSAVREAPAAAEPQPAPAAAPQQPAAEPQAAPAQPAAADQPIPGDLTAMQAQLAQAIAERDRHRKHAQLATLMTMVAAGAVILIFLYAAYGAELPTELEPAVAA